MYNTHFRRIVVNVMTLKTFKSFLAGKFIGQTIFSEVSPQVAGFSYETLS